jgi:hypothetical protein
MIRLSLRHRQTIRNRINLKEQIAVQTKSRTERIFASPRENKDCLSGDRGKDAEHCAKHPGWKEGAEMRKRRCASRGVSV